MRTQLYCAYKILWIGCIPTGGNAAYADKSNSPNSRCGEIPQPPVTVRMGRNLHYTSFKLRLRRSISLIYMPFSSPQIKWRFFIMEEKTQAEQTSQQTTADAEGIPQTALGKTAVTPAKRSLDKKKIGKMTTKAVAYTAVMTALVFVGTIIGFSNQAFYFNLGDAVILIAGALFNPVSAMLAGGLGAFFGDMYAYPATMLYTLVIKAVEGLVAGLLFHFINRWYDKKLASITEDFDIRKRKALALKILFSTLAALLSTMIMMTGYFMCQTLFYGTITSAILALPFDFAQGAISTAVAMLCLYALKLDEFRFKLSIK